MRLIIEGEESERNNGESLINVTMTPVSTSKSVMRGDGNNRRQKEKEIMGMCLYTAVVCYANKVAISFKHGTQLLIT